MGGGFASIKNQDPYPHRSDMLDPDPVNLQMTSQNVWTMSLFEHLFKGLTEFELLFGS
jgi:hypothetical protein